MAQWRCWTGKKVSPESPRQEVRGDWFQEYPIVDPSAVQLGVFGDGDLSPLDKLMMERRNVAAAWGTDEPKISTQIVQSWSEKITAQKLFGIWRVNLKSRFSGQG